MTPEQLATALISTATDFVGLVETRQNRAWDDPRTKIIETETMQAKPLSVDDAVLQLELTHSEFLVFKNSASGALSVVYKRRDGHYGLIVPTA